VARDLQSLGFIPPEAGDPATLGLVEPLGKILVQLSGGGGATKLNIDGWVCWVAGVCWVWGLWCWVWFCCFDIPCMQITMHASHPVKAQPNQS